MFAVSTDFIPGEEFFRSAFKAAVQLDRSFLSHYPVLPTLEEVEVNSTTNPFVKVKQQLQREAAKTAVQKAKMDILVTVYNFILQWDPSLLETSAVRRLQKTFFFLILSIILMSSCSRGPSWLIWYHFPMSALEADLSRTPDCAVFLAIVESQSM